MSSTIPVDYFSRSLTSRIYFYYILYMYIYYVYILHVFNLVHPSRLPNLRVLVRAIYVFRNFGFLSVRVGSQDFLGFQSVRFRFQEK